MAERSVRQARVIAADRTGLFQRVETPRAGRLRQADAFGERCVGDPGVLLKRLENREIDTVEALFYEYPAKIWRSDARIYEQGASALPTSQTLFAIFVVQ